MKYQKQHPGIRSLKARGHRRNNEESRLSPVFNDLHRARLEQARGMNSGCLIFVFVVALVACVPVLLGGDAIIPAALTAAVFILALFCFVMGSLDNRHMRVLPFFERRLGGIDTWLAGKDLLLNSRALDQIAYELGVTPLSEFASGDPLIPGETHALFEAGPALTTVDALLGAEITGMLGEPVISDLTRLRAALALAHEQGVRFSLHLREGSTASGHEMDLRKGSYF